VARHGYDLIIGGPFLNAVAVKATALKFPAATFTTVDADQAYLGRIPKNMTTFSTGAEQGAYLAGYLAALLEQRRPGKDVIGSVGGYPVQSVRDLIVGYEAGARKADPGITTLLAYSDNFSTPSRCKPLAAAQIAKGAGAVFDVAGICGLGVLAAAKERGVWGIGVDTDLAHLGPHILTSVVKVSEPLYGLVLRTYLDGTLRGGRNVPLGLREGVIALGKTSPRVPRAILARVERIRAQIAAGTIKVVPAKPEK
jgi:basic membrane protein A